MSKRKKALCYLLHPFDEKARNECADNNDIIHDEERKSSVLAEADLDSRTGLDEPISRELETDGVQLSHYAEREADFEGPPSFQGEGGGRGVIDSQEPGPTTQQGDPSESHLEDAIEESSPAYPVDIPPELRMLLDEIRSTFSDIDWTDVDFKYISDWVRFLYDYDGKPPSDGAIKTKDERERLALIYIYRAHDIGTTEYAQYFTVGRQALWESNERIDVDNDDLPSV